MANFFRYLGAAAPALNASARTALDIAREMREGPLREAESQQRQALGQQRMEQEKYEFEQKKKQDAEADAPMEGSLILEQFTAGWDEDKKNIGKQMLIKHGIMSPEGITTKRKMQDAQKQILMSKQASVWVQEAKREASLKQGQELFDKKQKTAESGDPAKLDEATKQYDQWNQQHNLMLGNFEKMEKMRTGMDLYRKLKPTGVITPELEAAIMVVVQTGEGIDDALDILKTLAKKQGVSEKPLSESEKARNKLEEARQSLKKKELDIREKELNKPKTTPSPKSSPAPKATPTTKGKSEGYKPPLETFFTE